LRDETVERGVAPVAAVERLSLHLAAIVGITFLAVGAEDHHDLDRVAFLGAEAGLIENSE
jgi:hypothetical protein